MNQDMMARLNAMQEQLAKAQEEIESRVAEATSGGGAVKVEVTGAYRVKSVHIEPEVVDPDDMGMLEDLVLAAMNEALEKVQAFHSDSTAGLMGGEQGSRFFDRGEVLALTGAVGDHHVQVLAGMVISALRGEVAGHLGQPGLDGCCEPTVAFDDAVAAFIGGGDQ